MMTIPRNWIKAASLFFMPQKGNDFMPHSLRARAVGAYLLIAVFVKAASLLSGFVLPSTQLFADVSTQFVIALTNQERANQGLPVLAENQILDRAACEKAQDMVANRYFSHDSPQGIDPWHWFRQAGYLYTRAGENLAIDFFNSKDVVDAWLNSASHRANILGNYQDIGLCVTQGNIEGYNSTLVVQLFGTPKAPIPRPNTSVAPTPKPGAKPVSSPAASAKPAVEGLATVQPSATPQAVLAGPINTTNLSLSLVKEKPQLFGTAWDTLVDPFWLYGAFLAYLAGILLVGVFARVYTPRPQSLAGLVAVMVVVAGLMALPSAKDVLHLQARVLPPVTQSIQ